MRRSPVALVLAAIAALVVPAVAVAGNGGIAPPTPSSPTARGIEDVYWLILAFAGLVFFVVMIPLTVFIVRFRSRGRAREVEGPQIRGNTNLELAWTIAPVLILFAIGSFVFLKLPGITNPARAGGKAALTVTVEGRQFYWRFLYANGAVSYDTLRLPLGQTAALRITAPDWDVAHSFWAPQLAGKRDAIPGQTTTMKIRPTRAGTYRLRCAEFCGVQHAAMTGHVDVVPPSQFRSWLKRQRTSASSVLGKEIFEGVCSKCHGPDVAGKIGPSLQGNPAAADANGVKTIVEHGRRAMPAVGRGWSDGELNSLVTYVTKTVAKQGSTSGG